MKKDQKKCHSDLHHFFERRRLRTGRLKTLSDLASLKSLQLSERSGNSMGPMGLWSLGVELCGFVVRNGGLPRAPHGVPYGVPHGVPHGTTHLLEVLSVLSSV